MKQQLTQSVRGQLFAFLIIFFVSMIFYRSCGCSEKNQDSDLKIQIYNKDRTISLVNNEQESLYNVQLEINGEFKTEVSVMYGETLELEKKSFYNEQGKPFPESYRINVISAFWTDQKGNLKQFYSER